MTELFNQIASEADKNYARAYHDLKTALNSFEKLTPVQQRRLLSELSIEIIIKNSR